MLPQNKIGQGEFPPQMKIPGGSSHPTPKTLNTPAIISEGNLKLKHI